MSEEDKKWAPLLPYTASMCNNFIIYDNIEYVRDRDLCQNKYGLVSGNIVKYYSAAYSKEAEPIPTGE